MLIAMPLWASVPVKATPVASASSNVSTQNAASIVIDTRHDSTRRLNQSSTTAKYPKAPRGLRHQHLYYDGYLSVARKSHPKLGTLEFSHSLGPMAKSAHVRWYVGN